MVLGGTRCQVVSNTDAKLVLDKTVTVGDKGGHLPGRRRQAGLRRVRLPVPGQGRLWRGGPERGHGGHREARGSSGTADPLDQRSSVGWKGVHAAAILYDEYMVRVECGSSYSDEDKAN